MTQQKHNICESLYIRIEKILTNLPLKGKSIHKWSFYCGLLLIIQMKNLTLIRHFIGHYICILSHALD